MRHASPTTATGPGMQLRPPRRPFGLALACVVALAGCFGGGGDPDDAISNPLSSDPRVASNGLGDYVVSWTSGVNVNVRYYRQGVGSQNFVAGPGERARVAMGPDGKAYLAYQSLLTSAAGFGYQVVPWVYYPDGGGWVSHLTGGIGTAHIYPHLAAGRDSAMLVTQRWGLADDSPRENLSHEYGTSAGRVSWWSRVSAPQSFLHPVNPQTALEDPPTRDHTTTPPRVAVGPDRRAMGMWIETNPAGRQRGLHISRYRPNLGPADGWWSTHWHFPYPLVHNAEDRKAEGHDLRMMDNGDTLAVWSLSTQSNSGQIVSAIYAMRYSEASDTWSPSRQITSPLTQFQYPALAMNARGQAILATLENPGSLYVRHHDMDQPWESGTAWSTRLQLGSASPDYIGADIAPDGTAVIVWRSGDSILMSQFDGAAWSPAETIGRGTDPQAAASNGGGCLIVWADEGFIRDFNCQKPVAAFDFEPLNPVENEQVTFNAGRSRDDRGSITLYAWDFGDDGVFDAQGLTAQHAFSAPGVARVRLRVTNDRGQTADVVGILELRKSMALGVAVSGNGLVRSVGDEKIVCGELCRNTYGAGASITLVATAAAGSEFRSWGGDCVLNKTPAERAQPNISFAMVDIGSIMTCTAEFQPLALIGTRLVVAIDGPGSVTSRAPAAGIDCPLDCEEIYPPRQTVFLNATPDAGAGFVRWSGDFDCTMESDPLDRTLPVAIQPTSPAVIRCVAHFQ